MTEIEKQQWDALYQYVKKEILQYDENQSLPQNIVLRLKGLQKGKLMANNNTKDYANYSFDVILNTFKICKTQILNAIQNKNFNDEITKFLYISKIVENNLNDVYLRMKKIKESQSKIQNIDTTIFNHEGANYKRKTEENIISKKYKKLW